MKEEPSDIISDEKHFRPSIRIPLFYLLVWGGILGLIAWAFLGPFILLFLFLPLFFIVSLFFLIVKGCTHYYIGDSRLIKKNKLFGKETIIHYENISHYDTEKGVMIRLRNGKIFNVDNHMAKAPLINHFQNIGLPKKGVNNHNRHTK